MKTNKPIILFTVILSFLTVDYSISQNSPATDSLKMLLDKSSGIEKANLLKEIGDNYQQTEYHHKAITYYQKSLEICNEFKDTLLQASVLREIGAAYYYLYDFDKALEYYLEALKLYEQINNQNGILITLNRIGNTYLGVYNNDKALKYYLKSYKISEQTGNKKGLYSVLNNIGILYLNKNDDKALEYFQKALLLMKESNDSSNMSAPILNIALVYSNMQKYDTALYYCFKALKLNENLNNKLGIARITSNIANQYIYKNNLYTAKIYLDSSLKISNEIDAKGLIKNNYYNYTLLYAIKSELSNMQIYSKLFWDISDTIINEQSSRLIAEMQTKYETEKKEQQIKMLNIKNMLKEAQLQARTYWLLIFIIAFALVVIFVIILFIQKRNLLFANRNLVRKNLEIVASERKIIDANAKLHPVITGDKKTLKEKNENLTIKYSSSPLTDEQKQIIKKQVINYFNNSRNYLNTDYSINTLAKEIHISRTYISQIINEMFGQSFSAFLNEYRIKKARKIMSDPSTLKYTIEYIAGLVGYKSKTAFNNAFKTHVGVTPSFYLNYIKKDFSLGTVHE